MEARYFFDFRNQKSSGNNANYPKLAEISKVQFHKGEMKMFSITSFGESENQFGGFLQKKFWDQCPKEIPCKI